MDKHQWHGPESQAASDYVEGRLKDRPLFEEHLEECTRCRLDVEALRRMQGRTRTWDEEQPYHQKRTYRPLFSGLALSLPILLVLGGLYLSPRPQPGPTRPAGPAPAHSWETGAVAKTFSIGGQLAVLGPHTRLERTSGNALQLMTGQLRLREQQPKFRVDTEQIEVHPLAGEFEVYHHNGLSRVHLISGKVKVRQRRDGRIFLLTRQQAEWPAVVVHPKLPEHHHPAATP